MSQHPEDLNVFKERLHAQIKEDLEPSILLAKQELLEKMKQCRDDKAKKQQCLQEYNDAVVVIDRAGKERFRDELLREKMRRNAGGWGTSPDRSQSRVGDFAMGGFASPAEAQEWNYESLFQQRSTPGLGHNRSRSQIGNDVLNNNQPEPSRSTFARYLDGANLTSPGVRPTHDALLQSTAKAAGVDEATVRRFTEEQARLLRAHTPATPTADSDALRKFTEEQARLHRAHSPEIPRNETQSRFMEEQARLNRIHSPDQSRSGVRSRAGHTPTTSTEDARITAFLEQQLQADKQQTQDARISSGSKLGQNSNRSTPAFYNNATGRRVSATQPSPLTRFPPAASAHGAMSPSSTHEKDVNLTKVEVLFFDLDGAILDWEGTVAKELRRQGDRYFPELPGVDWEAFTRLWRKYHRADMLSLAARGQSLPASTVYRTTLDELLTREGEEHTPRWTPAIREKLVEVWERCQAWPDAQEGLKAMKEIKTVATLSNWPLRTQTQMSRHAGLTWDVCLSGSLLGYYKPRPEAYKKAALSMSVDPTNCAIVSVNLDDLRGAHEAGMKTVYVRRPSEDVTDEELSKLEGSEIDLVVESFEHLAIILGCED